MSHPRTIAETLLREKVIAILRGLRGRSAERVVDVLRRAGLLFIEITLEAGKKTETLSAVRTAFGNSIFLGAGSILTVDQAEAAVQAGAQYLVSPGLFEDVSEYAKTHGVLYIPGVFSATEVGMAIRWGHSILKLFPAGLLGPQYLRALQAPYPRARFIAVGNIGVDDVVTYLRAGAAGVAVGSQLVGRGDDLRALARRARALVTGVRTAVEHTQSPGPSGIK